MSGQKKDNTTKPATTKESGPKKDTPPFATGHSQDADRHSKTKHPVSDK